MDYHFLKDKLPVAQWAKLAAQEITWLEQCALRELRNLKRKASLLVLHDIPI